MNVALDAAFEKLTNIQRKAVDWGEGAVLVLAGPGSGKTQVLTCRISRLLDSSRSEKFRVLALTFTNKAADEMKERVSHFVPDLEERVTIGTFHSFCAQVLRQHGVHIGVNPNFAIYSSDQDRRAILEDAVKNTSSEIDLGERQTTKYLGIIDQLKSRLIAPPSALEALSRSPDPELLANIYQLYEDELQKANALDFSSLLLKTHQLFTSFPKIAERYGRTYPYWLVDEFQDTNRAQYSLLQVMAGGEFKNVFAVADDDQIIYQWNGASFRQLQRFRSDFSPSVIQLPTNFRCPPAIVSAANRLVAYNSERTDSKQPLIAGKVTLRLPKEEHIQIRNFETDDEEAESIAQEIKNQPRSGWSETCVLARTRHLLEKILDALTRVDVDAQFVQRRDDFLSPEFRWLVACGKQIVRPLDKRNLSTFVEAYNRMTAGSELPAQIIAEAEASGQSYLKTWVDHLSASEKSLEETFLIDLVRRLTSDSAFFSTLSEKALAKFSERATANTDSDLEEDCLAWQQISKDVRRHLGKTPSLDQFLQELQLRSKEPSPKHESVVLMTIHGAKGREFDFVYLIGLAEEVLPSFQSTQKGDHSPEMEEERRNCFVAITRAKECLVLSRANTYKGWQKAPSRFLSEMGLV